MDPVWSDPSVEEIERRRIPGHVARGRGAGPPFAFGAIFLLAGVALSSVGFGFVAASTPLARGGALSVMRFLAIGFVGIGAYLLSWTHSSRRRRRQAFELAGQGSAWRVDHPWDPRGRLRGDGARALGRGAVGIGVLLALLVPLHAVFVPEMLSRGDRGAAAFWIPAIVLGFFDSVLLLGAADLVLRALRWLRFGRVHLECGAIPLRLGRSVGFDLVAGAALTKGQEVSARLRCVAETFLERRRDSRTRIEQISYALFEMTRSTRIADDGRARFEFELPGPDEALGNDLVSDPPRYWELEVRAEREGLDLAERFLLPIYDDRARALGTPGFGSPD